MNRTDPAIIEAAAQVIYNNGYDEERSERHYMTARAVLRTVTPMIRAAALEDAAKVAEEHPEYPGEVGMGDQIATAIRALAAP